MHTSKDFPQNLEPHSARSARTQRRTPIGPKKMSTSFLSAAVIAKVLAVNVNLVSASMGGNLYDFPQQQPKCEADIRDVVVASYILQNSQVLTKNMYSYVVYQDSSYLDKFEAILGMGDGDVAFDDTFPVLRGITASYDIIYRDILDPYEYADYKASEAAATPLFALEANVISLWESNDFDGAMDLLTSQTYYDAKAEIEFYAKRVLESVTRRLITRGMPPPRQSRYVCTCLFTFVAPCLW